MNEQILVVEDEHDTAELLRYNLEKANYRPVIARNGEEAINAVQCNAPELVLLDVMLPELNGWEVCRVLRESSKGKAIPIIMLTALAGEETRIKGLSLGADDYITKPFSVRELLLKMRKYINVQQEIKRFHTREQEHTTSLRYLVHELRNSMTVISGFSTLALRKDDPGHYLRTIKSFTAHVDCLLADASLLSRLERGEDLRVAPVDIRALAGEVVGIFRDTVESINLEVTEASGALSLVRGNKTAIRQILINLVSNAVKYNRENGRIRICFDETGNRVDVSVNDEGRGITQDKLQKIFEKFYRAPGSEKVKGAGLGLYIVKLLTEAMGGEIRAASSREKGSTFTVSLQKSDMRGSGDAGPGMSKAAYSH